MARSLLVAPAAEDASLAGTCLGLLRALDRRGVKVAFVKPVAQPGADGGPDPSAALVSAITPLRRRVRASRWPAAMAVSGGFALPTPTGTGAPPP